MINIDNHSFYQFCFPTGKQEERVRLPLRALTDQQTKVFNLVRVGWEPKAIAGRMDMPLASVYDAISKIRHWGYEL